MALNVLHITGWYPNHLKPFETPFIQRHVDALAPHVRNTVWHIDVRHGTRWSLIRRNLAADRTYILTTPMQRWRVLEWLATVLILWAWSTRDRSTRFDAVNFHIAYPNCTHIGVLQRIMGLPLLITEHWSIYRLGFNSGAKGLDRIRNIFHRGLPLIVVSKALAGDILRFAGPPEPPVHIIPNAISTAVFRPLTGVVPEEGRFFAIATWRHPKQPLVMIAAIAELRMAGLPARLRIAGGGTDIPAMQAEIDRLGLMGVVELIGQATPEQAATEMRAAHALLHVSDYETYSAVCAEALCCGTPVFASRVGGIPEYLTPDMGVLVHTNVVNDWADAIRNAWDRTWRLDRTVISARMTEQANNLKVGALYAEVITSTVARAQQATVAKAIRPTQ